MSDEAIPEDMNSRSRSRSARKSSTLLAQQLLRVRRRSSPEAGFAFASLGKNKGKKN